MTGPATQWPSFASIVNAIQNIAVALGSLNQTLVNGTGGGGAVSILPWTTISTSQLAASGNLYLVDTTAAPVTLTLPASPIANEYIYFGDGGSNFAANNLTIARNGSTIMGAAADLTVNTNGAASWVVYNGTTWRVTS